MTTAAEYKALIEAEPTLLHYWPMQEAAGATAAVASVGGVNLTLTGGPVCGSVGQLDKAIYFDGSNDFAVSAAALPLGYSKIVVEGVFRFPALTVSKMAFELGPNAGSNAGTFNYVPRNNNNTQGAGLLRGNVGLSFGFYTMQAADSFHLVTCVYDMTRSTQEVAIYVDGLAVALEYQTDANNTGLFSAVQLFYLMSRAGTGSFCPGYVSDLAIYTDLSEAKILEHATALGVFAFPNVYTVQASDLHDNGYDNVAVPRQSTYSRFKFSTDAENIIITGTTSLYASYPSYSHLGVIVDGVADDPLVFTANGQKSLAVSMAAGTKVVEIVAGLQSKPAATVLGSFIDSVSYPDGASFVVDTSLPSGRILFYGDSITAGGNATNSEYAGYPAIVRNTHGFDVMVEAWGFRSLFEDTSTPELLQAFAARLASYSPDYLWLAIGTNDYGLEDQSAEDFGTRYTGVLDAFHALAPTVTVICQSPLLRSTETANNFGDTLGDYRAAIQTACQARDYTFYIDGLDILEIGDLADGTHPSTDGHLEYANFCDSRLNYLITPPVRAPLTIPGPLGIHATVTAGTTYPAVTIKAPLGAEFQAIPEFTGEAVVDLATLVPTPKIRTGPKGTLVYSADLDAAGIIRADRVVGA